MVDRYELARLSYGEVLDATKHQDDKVGRLVGAVAFLTGGALVFADQDLLAVDHVLAGREYPLTALFLGTFLVLDIVAVLLWFMAMATPLTYPGIAGRPKEPSYLFFEPISRLRLGDWQAKWAGHDRSIERAVTRNLVDEAHNLARRAASKYQRSRVASAVFMASVFFLLPTLVLSIDSARQPRPAADSLSDGPGAVATAALTWDEPRRIFVGGSVALFVLVVAVWARFQLRPGWDRQPGAPDHRRGPATALCFFHPLVVFALVVANGRREALGSGLPVIAVAGVATAGLLARLSLRAESRSWGTQGFWAGVGAGIVGLVTLLGVVGVVNRRSDAQLLSAMALACVSVLGNLGSDRPPRPTDAGTVPEPVLATAGPHSTGTAT